MPQDKADITAAGPRLREMNAALSDWDRIRQEGEQISREEAYSVLTAEIASLRAENERRREEARRLTQQDDAPEDPMAWLAFAIDGSDSCAVYIDKAEAQAAADALGGHIVPLHLSPRLTDDERAAVEWCLGWCKGLHVKNHATLRGLLERMSGDGDCRAADNAAMRDNALRLLAELDEELGLPRTPNPHAAPGEGSVPPQRTEDGGK